MSRRSIRRLNTLSETALKHALENKTMKPGGLSAEQIMALSGKKVVKQRITRGGTNKSRKSQSAASIAATRPTHPYRPPPHREAIVPDWFDSKGIKDVDVSIIVPCYKSSEYIAKQIATWDLDSCKGLVCEIIYVDDYCPQKSHQQIIQSWHARINQLSCPVGKIVLMSKNNGGFANACNVGARLARGKFLVFLNADTRVTPGWIKPMMETLSRHENAGIVGNLHLREDGAIDSCGSEWNERSKMFMHIGKHVLKGEYLRRPLLPNDAPKEIMTERDVQMVTGACFMMRKELFQDIGGFDTEYRIGYWEDSDICMKVHAVGSRVMFNPESVIVHRGGHSNSGSHEFVRSNYSLFHEKWIKTGFLDELVRGNKPAGNNTPPKPEQIVVYTAITNDKNRYDHLKEQKRIDSTEYVAFLNSPVKSDTWSFREIHGEFADPCRNAKIHKILSHVYFPDKEYSLWIDGSVKVLFPFPVSRLIQMYLSDCDMALFRHCGRKCVYEEATTCVKMRLDDPVVMKKQVERYKSEGYPPNAGLSECTVLLRRHTDQIKRLNEMWWSEICKGSRRDQLSFDYVARACGVRVRHFMGCLPKKNCLFERHMHNYAKS